MDRYHIALFIHLVTLVVASAATAVTKIAVGRRARARTIADVIDWHDVLMSASKLFPICLALFVITGSYMLSLTDSHAWSSGFIVAGLVGATLLLASGVFLGIKGRALKHVLDEMAKGGMDKPAPKLVPPPLIAALPAINTGIALAVVFDMVTKPASVPVALAIVAVGIALGAASGMRRPAAAAERATAA
ncbi:MAG TPA: hypothetical protein VN706_03645 [Gemmatimonadaceae bacterium]|nr:hypothetical protein [Gemmatimonadaceae bacterium]